MSHKHVKMIHFTYEIGTASSDTKGDPPALTCEVHSYIKWLKVFLTLCVCLYECVCVCVRERMCACVCAHVMYSLQSVCTKHIFR